MGSKTGVEPRLVRETFDYLPESGRLVRVRNKTAGKIGKMVGHVERSGNNRYRRIPFSDSGFQASWMVWAWHHGEFPSGMLIHKNGDTLDDRIENLALHRDMRRPVKVAHDLPEENQPETMLGDLPACLNTGIYEIRNTKNGRKYIGSAINISKRWRQHLKQLEGGKHHSCFMQRCWNKNGGDNFVFRVILTCSRRDLVMYEQIAIDSIKPCYNSNPTAASMLGHKHSPESKKKMSASRPKDFSPMKGRHHSESTKRKISEAKKGVKQDPKSVLARAESVRKLKGRHSAKKFTESQIRDIRGRCIAGEKNIVLAREYGVSDSVICEIKKHRAYRWVD